MPHPTKPITSTPADRELVHLVKKAACQHFEITEEQLVTEHSRTVANIRFLCYWIIARNTQLKDYAIGDFFNRRRACVIYGIEHVDVYRKIYRQTIDNLRSLAEIANTFDKKHAWRIQSINTTN